MVPLEGVVTPQTRVVLAGRGLPGGDLCVCFEVRFPEFLTLEQKERLAAVL